MKLAQYSFEFRDCWKVSYKTNSMAEGVGEVAIMEEALGTVDCYQVLDQLMEDQFKEHEKSNKRWASECVEYNNMKCNVLEFIKSKLIEWAGAFHLLLDVMIEREVREAIYKKSVERCKIEELVFNFSGVVVDSDIMEALRLGAKYIVNILNGPAEAQRKMEKELLEYLNLYRRYIERKDKILEYGIMGWLDKALVDSEDYGGHRGFYSSLRSALEACEFSGRAIFRGLPEQKRFEYLDGLGVVVVEADKDCGLCILGVESMKRGEESVISELGGVKVDRDVEDIQKCQLLKIEEFEDLLGSDARKFLNSFYPDRMDGVEVSMLPFLKIRPKIHKLSQNDLEKREVESLKFRPVIDASRTVFKHYAKALMDYCRGLINKVQGDILGVEDWLVRNGHEVAEYFKRGGNGGKGGRGLFIVADLSSAYSYVYLEDLVYAMNKIAAINHVAEWKRKLFEDIATLVLQNWFVEAGTGIFKMGDCLPMGLCASGEGLDVVLLMYELVSYGQIEIIEDMKFVKQYSNCLTENERHEGRIDSERRWAMFDRYWRYRDDIFSDVAVNGCRLRDILDFIGCMFPPSLDMNFQLSMHVGSYLDTMFYRKISGTGFECFVKRKVKYPISYLHSSSPMSGAIVRNIISGELLRYRRICSSMRFVEVNDECLVLELVARGYSEKMIRKIIAKRVWVIGEEYDERYVRLHERGVPKGLVYGATVACDSVWRTDEKVLGILSRCLPRGIR